MTAIDGPAATSRPARTTRKTSSLLVMSVSKHLTVSMTTNALPSIGFRKHTQRVGNPLPGGWSAFSPLAASDNRVVVDDRTVQGVYIGLAVTSNARDTDGRGLVDRRRPHAT